MTDNEVHAITNGGMATLVALIGRIARYRIDNGLIFAVKIDDVKLAYGKVRVLIVPVAGSQSASAWVDLGSVNLVPKEGL